jgi:hypothetical protein
VFGVAHRGTSVLKRNELDIKRLENDK